MEVGTGILLLDGLNMAAIKEIFELPYTLKTTQFHIVCTYDMRDCYVANAAPLAKATKYVLGEKKSLKGLSNDGKQVRARMKAPFAKGFMTKEEKVKRKRQTGCECCARQEQRKQADMAAPAT